MFPRSPTSALLLLALALLTDPSPGAAATPSLPPSPAHQPSARQWPLDAQHGNAARVWPISTGAGVIVAVVDSGVDARHGDLAGRVLPGADFTGHAVNGRVDLSADAHGTSVAGIIAGTGRGGAENGVTGLAPAATILPVRVADGAASDPVSMAQGIDYATTHGARIINISICTPVLDPQVRAAVDAALHHDVVVVAAAGNDGLTGNPPQYPAAIPGVLAVAGSDRAGRRWPNSESGDYIGLVAPAVGIHTTGPQGGYLSGTGTSFAAPHVAAAAALLRSRYPRENATQIIARLTGTADPVEGQQGRTPQAGYGLVAPYRALTVPPPPTDVADPLSAHPAPAPAPAESVRSRHPAGLLAAIGVVVAGLVVIVVRKRRSTG